MLRYVLHDLRLFDTNSGDEYSRKGLLHLLEALTRWDQLYLAQNPDTPKLYRSGVVYKIPEQFETSPDSPLPVIANALGRKANDPKVAAALEEVNAMCGGERFRDIPAIIENGGGDCDNLATWRCAELRQSGIEAMPYVTWRRRPGGGMTYHALVILPDKTSEDPSLLLGMGGDARKKDRDEEVRKNAERQQLIEQAVKSNAQKVALRSAPPAPVATPLPPNSMVVDWGDE